MRVSDAGSGSRLTLLNRKLSAIDLPRTPSITINALLGLFRCMAAS